MAVDLWPYSGRSNGRVTDAEHEALWAPIADGVLPGEPSNALAVSVSGGGWNVQPGRIHIAGHVLALDAVESGSVPAPSSATVWCTVAAYIDRSQTPWTYGVRLVVGTPGGGAPSLSTAHNGRYEVALRSFTVAPSGAVNVRDDERVILTRSGRPLMTPWRNLTLAGNFKIYNDTPQYRILFESRRAEFRGTVARSDNGPMPGADDGTQIVILPAEAAPVSPLEQYVGTASLTGPGTSGSCRIEVKGRALRVFTQDSPTWIGIYGGIWID